MTTAIDGRTVTQLITDGVTADPDDVTDALAMNDYDWQRLVGEVAPDGEDEHAWVTLLDPQVITRTLATLAAMRYALTKAIQERPERRKENGDRLGTVRARMAQVKWAQQRHRTERVERGRREHEANVERQRAARLSKVRAALDQLRAAVEADDLEALGLDRRAGAKAGVQVAIDAIAVALVLEDRDWRLPT